MELEIELCVAGTFMLAKYMYTKKTLVRGMTVKVPTKHPKQHKFGITVHE